MPVVGNKEAWASGVGETDPANNLRAITPSDTDELATYSRALSPIRRRASTSSQRHSIARASASGSSGDTQSPASACSTNRHTSDPGSTDATIGRALAMIPYALLGTDVDDI